MKILLINDYAVPKGGANIITLAIRERLRKRGHDVRLFTSYARLMGSHGIADYECFGTVSRFNVLTQTFNVLAFLKLRQVLNHFQPDIVHVRMFLYQLSPLILPLLRHWKSIYHVATYEGICPLGTKMLPDRINCQQPAGLICYDRHCLPLRAMLPQMLRMKLWRRWQNAFNLIIANSNALKHALSAEGIGPVEVLWNGVPIQPLRQPLFSPPTVAFAGRLTPAKGVDILVQAFSKIITKIPESRLLLVGDGPEKKRLNRLIANLQLSSRVSLSNHISRYELERYFASAWVQIVPSLFAEPFGNVAAEAMMRGTVVIASRTGGLTEFIRDGETGILFPPGDVNALAEALLLLLNDPKLAEKMGKAGRKFALTYLTEEIFIDKLIHIYKTLYKDTGK